MNSITNKEVRELIAHKYDFWQWCEEAFQPHYVEEVEEYLLQSDDIFDLDRRIKLVEIRGMV